MRHIPFFLVQNQMKALDHFSEPISWPAHPPMDTTEKTITQAQRYTETDIAGDTLTEMHTDADSH